MQISTSTSGKPLQNSLRHLLRKCHLPRRGRLPTSERVCRDRCPYLSADGWGQPSLRQGRCGIVGAFCERPRANTVRPYDTDSTPVRVVGAYAHIHPFIPPVTPHPPPAAVPLFARRETAPLLSATPTFSPAIGGNRPQGEGFPVLHAKNHRRGILGGGFCNKNKRSLLLRLYSTLQNRVRHFDNTLFILKLFNAFA